MVGDQVHPMTTEIMTDLVSRRWSRARDIANAVEDFGVDAMMYYADATDSTLQVSIELSRLHSSLLNLPVVRSKLYDDQAPSEVRVKLFRELFGDKNLNKVTMRLAEHATCNLRRRRYLETIQWLIKKFSRHMGQSMITVTTAAPLKEEQIKRLIDVYSAKVGRQVHINSVVDPTVLGGMRIQVGDEVTDNTVVAQLTGLPGCMANELLTFEDGTLGLAFNLDAREIGVVILGDFAGIEEGQEVRRTGEVLSVPVGDGYLGRVVDPLGNPIDGLGEIQGIEGRRILEAQAPDVMHRHPVDEPLSTGLKAIDAMTPVGRGQRQLIIGDRQTGKTAIAIDTIINQKANWESGDPKKQVITDGQIFLQSDLFNANQRPAVDVGISVSRVGGAAQTKALKKVSGTLKISLAQYRSLESFAMFASDLDAASKAQLTRGAHLTELLKQPQFHPYSMEQEVVSVWTGTHGKLDDLELSDVLPFEQGLLDYIDHNTDILKTIRETEDFTADTEAALDKAVDEFRSTFVSSNGKPLVEKKPDVAKAAPVDQEKIVAGEK